VDQVQVDVEQRLLAGLGMHDVCIPDFFEHGARHSGDQWLVVSDSCLVPLLIISNRKVGVKL
jgi:hypothetical protein